jgi:hypothetical protein
MNDDFCSSLIGAKSLSLFILTAILTGMNFTAHGSSWPIAEHEPTNTDGGAPPLFGITRIH